MVIGKISSLATTIFIFALGFVFLKQAYATSIGASGQDVGAGLVGASSGVTSLFNAFINPITGLISTFSSFFGSFGDSNGSRSEPLPTGREDRKTPTQKVRTSDTSKITWASGTSATVPTLSAEAKSYYKKLGVNVS
jgi:hypothetical protein